MADVSQIVLKDANGNVIGTYDVKDTSVPHDSKAAASGGTTLSLVTTGEKATWNAKSDTDTKNTAGSTNSTSKLYLIGALEQSANPQTYSNSNIYYELGTIHTHNFKAHYFNNTSGAVLIDGNGIIQCQNSSGVGMSSISSGSDYYGGQMAVKDPTGTFNAVELTGRSGLVCNGVEVTLGTSGSSSNDSGDIVWKYGNGREKARLWTDNTYTSAKGLNYRLYKEDGTQLTSGSIPLTNTYLPLAGGTMTGSVTCTTSGANLKWGNITLYGGGSNDGNNSILIGDDVTIGDCNAGGCFGMKSTGNNAGFKFFNSSGNSIGGLQSTNGTLQWINSSGTAYNVMPQTDDLSSSLSVSGNLQSVTKKLFKCTNVVELFVTGKVKTAIADNAVIFTVPTGYNPKVNDVGFTFFTGSDPYIPTGFKFGYFTWGGRDFHTLGALGVGTQVTVHITYLI